MALQIQFNYENPSNYVFDSNKIEFVGGVARLKRKPMLENFTEGFNSSTGFIFDSDKIIFDSGQMKQKSQRPTDSTFVAKLSSNINGNYGDGVLTGTAFGGATVVSGWLDLNQGDVRGVDFDANLNADSQQLFSAKFKIKPGWTGATPPFAQTFLCITHSDGDSTNNILLYITTSGMMRIQIRAGAPKRRGWWPVRFQ